MVTSVKVAAEMQAPSQTIPLDLVSRNGEASDALIAPGKTLQSIVRFDLREEGNHVLAVSVSYSETMMSKDRSASSGRVRTFRKLYQFIAQPCLSVRTKVSELPSKDSDEQTKPTSKRKLLRFALEAQLDNMADGPITLEKVFLDPKTPFVSKSLNWDLQSPDSTGMRAPTLAPRDVTQVAFLIEQQHRNGAKTEMTKDGRIVLGRLSIQWRTAMGDTGYLSTGWLMTRKR